MEDLFDIYKEAQNDSKDKAEIFRIKCLKDRLLENIKTDQIEGEPAETSGEPVNKPDKYDRYKFLYYKITTSAYSIDPMTDVLSGIAIIFAVGSFVATIIGNSETTVAWIVCSIIAFLVFCISISLLIVPIRKKIFYKINIAKEISIILDDIEKEAFEDGKGLK